MNKKVTNHSLVILVLIVSFGLFQAWKEEKNPFAFYSNNKNQIKRSDYLSNKSVKHETKKDYIFKLYFKE